MITLSVVGSVCTIDGAGEDPLLLPEVESLPGGIEKPGVVVRALHAGVQPQCLSRQLASVGRTRVRQRAVGLTLHVAPFLPFGVVSQGVYVDRVLHPLNDLKLKLVNYCSIFLPCKKTLLRYSIIMKYLRVR